MRQSGIVKWFNDSRGMGFITRFDGVDVFVRATSVQQSSGFRILAEGNAVEFDEIRGPKGLEATNVTRV